MHARPLTGKTALVTGAGRNIGRAIVVELARQGANVIVNARSNRAEAEAVAAEARALGAGAIVVLGDIAALATIETVAREAEAAFGGVDIYVSNAMYRKHQAFHDTTVEDWHRYLEMQLGASFYLARTFAPAMARRGWGRIIHITGPDGFVGVANRIANVVAKGGLRSLTKALARELGPSGITVNDIAPGMHDTVRDPVTHPFVNDPDWIDKAVRSIPVGRLGTAEDVAWCCGFLASPRSGFITGQVLGCNGGELMIG
ncbi:MAG TPA: SDR family oxidoreductase [Kofleriaceae bacterium]|nr:SDR family oxidoreductase [Kofleriaceae bacterium]